MGPEIADPRHRLFAESEQKLQTAREQAPQVWERSLADPRVQASLPRVWAFSELAATIGARAPAILCGLVEDGSLFERKDAAWIAQDIAVAVHGGTDADLME